MKLKSIEIQGFKSFRDKIKLQFNNPVCAIVGPNGSGKSNISDAIRWVLGEQSVKSLRGTKMQDVIFSGTEKSKPLNFAQVALNFDNTDKWIPIEYEEVNITRRVFRTGESEYYINRKLCRLKDLREIFMDTGIGKEGYSIIGQGRIDEILSSKSEDRRYIFEEASGISKFKYKKEESVKKLDKTISNLGRIEDILTQKLEQRDYLKNQSEKATVGLELTNEIKLLDLYFNKLDLEKFNVDNSKLISETKSLVDEIKEKEKLINEIEPEIDSLKFNSEKLKSEYEKLQEEYNKNEKTVSNFNLEYKLNEEKLNYNNSETKRLEEDKIYLEEKKITVGKKIESSLNTYNKTNDDFNNLELQINNVVKEKEGLKSELDKKKEDLNEINDEILKINEILKEIEVEKRTKESIEKSEKEKLDNDIANRDRLLIEYEELKSKYSNEETISKNISLNIDKISDNINLSKINIDEFRETINKLNNEKSELELRVKDLNREYIFNKNLMDNYEGFNKQVSTFFKKIKNTSYAKIPLGTVADLINIEDRYTKAVNNVLSGVLQNIVVEDESDAKTLINFLKVEKIGRLTFLPINRIKGKNIIPKFNDERIIAVASEIIHCDNKYKSIINYFLGKTLIVENLDSAIDISKVYKQYRIVTLDGDVFNSWGSVVGGYTNNRKSVNIINRGKNIEELKSKIEENMNNITSINGDINKYNIDINKLNIKYKNDSEELQKVELELENQENIMNKINTLIAIKENSLKDLNEQIEKYVGSFSSKYSDLNIKDLEVESKTNNIKYNELLNEINILKDNVNRLDYEIIKLNSKKESLERDIKLNKDILEEMNFEKSDITRRMENNDIQLIELLEEFSRRKEKSITLKAELEKSMKNSEELIKKIPEKKNNYELLLTKYLEKKDEVNDMKNIMSKLEYSLNLVNNKIENINTNRSKIKKFIAEEYNVEIEKFTLIENVENPSKSNLKSLRNKLKGLGYFSVDSIEEFKLINEEAEFLLNQKNDLLKSKDNIENIIKSLDKDMKVMFSKSFEDINEKFNKIFGVLFDGGHASLELQDKDILNGGIDIIAEPPGKKMQNLSLLSGGERALTAVALLFAIFETSPSPFCILDEIDAALDEANISRYTKYLRSFTDTTQFIMITHRKTTMEIADILYGVSMEEEGISKVISLELE